MDKFTQLNLSAALCISAEAELIDRMILALSLRWIFPAHNRRWPLRQARPRVDAG